MNISGEKPCKLTLPQNF